MTRCRNRQSAIDTVRRDSETRLLYVHRDLGPGFTHNPSPDCPCRPHVIEPSDTRPTEEILLKIAALERRGDA